MTEQPRHIRIAPSILDADMGRLAEQIAAVERAGATLLHLDVMDGHFVPNLSIGVPVVAGVNRCTELFLDTHLMITDPGKYAPAFVKAGADSITFHIEVTPQPRDLIRQIRDLGAKVGVSLNPGTPAEALFDILPEVDIVLVMTVWPGFGGQAFIRECLPKIESLKARLRPQQWLEVDGGINRDTAPLAIAAGADTLVAGSAVFAGGRGDAAALFHDLQRVCDECGAARATA
ncbi:Ribulose-phosphate 3-epimerase [Phycisphaerae bacterium RAS1]|nr:Ribulose-phosphate 3-epimerase [Phycisphaerae bacterium RAS1]